METVQSKTLPSDRFCFRPHGITIVNSTMFHIDNEMFNLVLLLNKIIYALYWTAFSFFNILAGV